LPENSFTTILFACSQFQVEQLTLHKALFMAFGKDMSGNHGVASRRRSPIQPA